MGDHPDSVATTWSLSFQRVEERNAAAADLLRLCVFLAPDAIPEDIIASGAEHLGPLLQTAARDPLELNKATAALGAYSLICRDTEKKILSIHRLVQAVLRDDMDKPTYRLWAERMIRAVETALPEFDYSIKQRYEPCFPHAQGCIQFINELDLISQTVTELLYRTGRHFKERAFYAKAEQFYLLALHIQEETLGSEHSDVAYSLNSIANLYKEQGKHIEAEPFYLRVLRIWEQMKGPEHLDMTTPLNNLAILYYEQGKYAEAEQLFQLQVAYPLTGLALLYHAHNKFEQAESLYQRVLTIREQ